MTATTNPREVLPGACLVVTAVAASGCRSWQPVGDAALPGGISRAMRMISPTIDIACDVARLARGVYLRNYSSPATAIGREADVSVVGLCHGVTRVEAQIAPFLGAASSSVTSLGVGRNRITFLTRLFDRPTPCP